MVDSAPEPIVLTQTELNTKLAKTKLDVCTIQHNIIEREIKGRR